MAEYPKEFIYNIDERRPITGVTPGGMSGINFNALGGIDGYVPKNDPTFSSGLNYAQSIAGGQNVPNMIAPGMSYSAENPQGYTQADLNAAAPSFIQAIPDDPAFLPGGGAVNPPDYTNLPPNIIGGGRGDNISILDDLRFPPPQDFLGKYKSFDFSGIQSILDSLKQDRSQSRYDISNPPPISERIPLGGTGMFGGVLETPPVMPPSRDDFISIDRINENPMDDFSIERLPLGLFR
jgi:hypothetical protein